MKLKCNKYKVQCKLEKKVNMKFKITSTIKNTCMRIFLVCSKVKEEIIAGI